MKAQRNLYLYPIEHSNGFISRTKQVFAELEYNILPFKALFSFSNIVERKRNWVVLNWYEDQPFRKGLRGIKKLLFLAAFFFSIVSLRLFSRKVIWVRHNFKPHNAAARSYLYSFTLRLLTRIADKVVTLEQTDYINASVAKHPLYKNDQQIYQFIESIGEHDKAIDYLYFGSIKPYKRLDALLDVWPVDKPLKIMGACSDAGHTNKIRRIIRKRGLQVDWENSYISDVHLEQAVSNTRFVILPHDDNAMISSGTFYFALGLGANVLCFDSLFARQKARLFPFVRIISRKNLREELEQIEYVDASIVIDQAMDHYSDKAIVESWRAILS